MRFSALIKSVAALGLLSLGINAQAIVLLTPSDADATGTGAANCEPTCVTTAFPGSSTPLTLYYKGEVGEPDEGTFADSYNTEFLLTPDDPSGATITWIPSTPSITCPECYLAVKDGNQSISYYFFNLRNWDGMEQISLSDFWPQQGAISHVAIWGVLADDDGSGGGGTIPLPGTVALVGLGLLAAGFSRSRKI